MINYTVLEVIWRMGSKLRFPVSRLSLLDGLFSADGRFMMSSVIYHRAASEMEIAEDRRTFGIKTAHTFFTLNILPAEEYPAVPDGLRTVYLYTEEQTEEPGGSSLYPFGFRV